MYSFAPKLFRTMKYIWNKLRNKRNYRIPSTIEEMKKVGFLSPCLNINGARWYFFDNKEDLHAIVQIIQGHEHLQQKVDINSVYKSVFAALEKHFCVNEITFEEFLDLTISAIENDIKEWEVIFRIEGLELVDLDQISLGKATIFKFTEVVAETLLTGMKPEHGRESFRIPVGKFISNNLHNTICVKCAVKADYHKAVQIARSLVLQCINFFRFVTCLLTYGRIAENLVKINLSTEAYTSGEAILAVNLSTGYPTLTTGRGRRSPEVFPLSTSKIAELNENRLLPFISSTLSNSEITELEGTILTALHWIGEAQNEFDIDVAFVKYWTAIESSFTGKSNTIQYTLASSISIVIYFSGYTFDEPIDPKHVYKRMIKLYDKRSDITHRGLRGDITYGDLSEICKYAAWGLLALMDLSMRGYGSTNQIQPEIDRLYNIIFPSGPSPET